MGRERERERRRGRRSILCRRQRRNVNMQVAKSLKGNVRGPALLSSRARNARTTSVSTPSVGHSVLHTAYLGKQRGPTRANASSVKAESGAGAGAGAGVTVDGDVGLAAKRRGLTLHLSDGSTLKVQLEPLHVVEMKQATLKFFDLFKEKETWERPRRLDQIKVNLKSGGDHDRASLEMHLFMNPNAYPTAFQAKVLFNLKHSGGNGVEVSTEIPLSKFSESLDLYLSQN